MNRLSLLLLIILLISFKVFPQTLSPEVISPSGDYTENEAGSLSYTIGECVTETLNSSENSLTQGFQQAGYEIRNLIENSDLKITLSLYPMPVKEILIVEIDENHEELSYDLLNIQGSLLLNGSIMGNRTELNLESYNSGEYILSIRDEKSKLIKSYQIVKF